MTLRHRALRGLNRWLGRANLRLETLTRERRERARLAGLEQAGHFGRPVFPLLPAMRDSRPQPVFDALRRFAAPLEGLGDPRAGATGYSYDNGFFPSPDAQVLYSFVRMHRPPTVVEIGSGNSTRVTRQAALDAGLDCEIVCVDPSPRVDVEPLASRIERRPVEELDPEWLLGSLAPGCMLFIDSSHELMAGGDLPYLYLHVLPRLASGVLVHIHDIFLPYEYPREWLLEQRWRFDEQYLVQAMLGFGARFEVLWAGHYLQRTRADFARYFPQAPLSTGSSLWLKCASR
jgi:hypothetical protein